MTLTELNVPQLSQETAKEYSKTILKNNYLYYISPIHGSSIIPSFEDIIQRQEDIIVPFVFDPFVEAGDISGAYWIIQPGGSSQTKHIISPEYQLEARGVAGKGWFLGWKRGEGVKIWPFINKEDFERTVTFDHNWVVCFIAHPKEKLFIVEGISAPSYNASFETEVKPWQDPKVTDVDGTFWCGIPDFWHEYEKFKTDPDTPKLSVIGP